MAKLKTIALTISSLSAASGAAYAQNATPDQVGMAMMRLNSSLLDQAKAQTFGTGSLWASLRKDFRMNEVNSELVRRHESKRIRYQSEITCRRVRSVAVYACNGSPLRLGKNPFV